MKVILIALGLMLANWSVFGVSGDEILKKVEEVLTREKDREAYVELILFKGGKEKERREMKMWSSGKDKRVVKFTFPDSVKGIGILSLPDGEMYVYFPAYKRVRAIQGTMKDQNFQGTDFSYREIGSFNYSRDFTSKVAFENQEIYLLELSRKPNSEWSYEKVNMTVSKETFLPKKLEMFEKGKLKKVLEVVEAEKKGNYYVLSRVRMTSLASDTSTEIVVKDVKFDQGLESKGIFTQRFLEK